MKIDTFTKIVLTSIAIFLGCIAFDYKPNIRAEAHTANSDSVMVPETKSGGVWVMKGNKIKYCSHYAQMGVAKDACYLPATDIWK